MHVFTINRNEVREFDFFTTGSLEKLSSLMMNLQGWDSGLLLVYHFYLMTFD